MNGTRNMCIDIKKSYTLCTPMNWYEYMRMSLVNFPEHSKDQYQLRKKAVNKMIYLDFWKSIYTLLKP